jgi:ribonucleoside-diphosphate reductase beta chain
VARPAVKRGDLSETVRCVSDELQLNDPQTLYRRWEDSQWSPFTIDLDTDRVQWPRLAGEQRELLLFAPSSLMVAKERITTKFSGLATAYGTEEEATFLSTQQVDEARHMQFYARFQDEVIAAPDIIGAHVTRARERISEPFRQIFDVELVSAHERLVAAPANPRAPGHRRRRARHASRPSTFGGRVTEAKRRRRRRISARNLGR